jgi:hypothetical protein
MANKRLNQARQRYVEACHAMQSGVALKMQFNPKDTSPKHLRVGVNSAMIDSAALATLLIKKGIFTEEEYVEALADKMEEEVALYQKELPGNVKLG